MGVSVAYAYLHSCCTFVAAAEQLARNLLGPLGSEVTLGLESHDGTKVDAKLCRAHLSKQKQAPRA